MNETRAPLTSDDLSTGIANALRAGDMQAAADMIRALAVVDPDRAETILAAVQILGGAS